jgi:hypothetical protein
VLYAVTKLNSVDVCSLCSCKKNCMYELKHVWRHTALIIASRQSIAASIQKFPDSVVKSVRRARHGQSRCVRRSDQVVDQFEVSR